MASAVRSIQGDNPVWDRHRIGRLIASRLETALPDVAAQWRAPHTVRAFVLDDLLPEALVRAVHAAFPATDRMMFKSSLRERKHVAAQMDAYDPLLEEIVYAFQEPEVVALISGATALIGLEPDAQLYAGGISAMAKGAYLRPHLDNSHDARRSRYRVLNLLFYVTPGWGEADGGALKLWDDGPTGAPRTIASRFNRLVVMATDRRSWHSVNEVRGDGVRACVSNYYFSPTSPDDGPYFHATSFRAEHGAGLSDMVMRADNRLRTAVLKVAGKLYRNPHGYRRESDG